MHVDHGALVRLHGMLFLKEINAFFIGPKEDRDLECRHVIGGWFIVGAPPAIGSWARPSCHPPTPPGLTEPRLIGSVGTPRAPRDIIAVYMQLNLYGGILPT